DAQGRIGLDIPPDTHEGVIVVRDSDTVFDEAVIPIRVGDLDPVDEESGQRARLNNLGYFAGPFAEKSKVGNDKAFKSTGEDVEGGVPGRLGRSGGGKVGPGDEEEVGGGAGLGPDSAAGGPVVSEGGITARHPVGGRLPVVLSPTHEDRHNVLRAPLIPIACWRVEGLRFDFPSSVPTPDITNELRHLGKLIEEHPDCPLSIFGHADPVGDDVNNKDLSGRRAVAIYALLVRDPGLWEQQLFQRPSAYDDWTKNSLQIMLDHVNGAPGQDTREHRASA